MKLREVTQSEYYSVLKKLDAVGTILGRYPYTLVHSMRHGREIGRVVDSIPEGEVLPKSRYYLAGCDGRLF